MKQVLKKVMPKWLLRRRWHAHFQAEMDGAGEPELRLLKSLVAPGRSAIDVGGNVGTYTFFLSQLAARVETFEPLPTHAWRLRALELANVAVHEVALSDGAGEAQLVMPVGADEDVDGMGSIEAGAIPERGRSFKVRRATLDSFEFKNVGFLKIDVEGHEESVLRGGLGTISAERPVCLIEIEERHNAGGLARINEMLGGLGYGCHFWRDGVRHPLSDFDAEQHQNPNRPGAYVNNFIFSPSGAP